MKRWLALPVALAIVAGLTSCTSGKPSTKGISESFSSLSASIFPTSTTPAATASTSRPKAPTTHAATTTSQSANTNHPCLGGLWQIRVCAAYTGNASGARLAYYRDGHGGSKVAAQIALAGLQSRFSGTAYQYIIHQTAKWPKDVNVDLPRISIRTVAINAKHTAATLTTRETWKIRTLAGTTLFAETGHPHTINLTLVSGALINKWVVTRIS